MAFGDYATLRDDFNYFDVPVSIHWTTGIRSGEGAVCYINSIFTANGSAEAGAWYKDITPSADLEAYSTVNGIVFGRHARVYGRLKDLGGSADGYLASIDADGDGLHIRAGRMTNSVITFIADSGAGIGWSDGDKLGLRCVDSAIEAWWYHSGAWSLAASAVDATYPDAGRCGLGTQGGGDVVTHDNFFMGDIPPPNTDVLSMQPHISGHGFW